MVRKMKLGGGGKGRGGGSSIKPKMKVMRGGGGNDMSYYKGGAVNSNGSCPKGVFCIENMTLVLIVILLIVGGYFLYSMYWKKEQYGGSYKASLNQEQVNSMNYDNNIRTDSIMSYISQMNLLSSPFFTNPNAVMSNRENDTLLNPYAPPLKENPYFPKNMGDVRGLPINVRTSGYDLDYKQIGILTRTNGEETIIPLFGRPVHGNRNKWEYYAMKDGNTMIKLPVSNNGRSCSNEYGCDEIYNGDNIYIEGYKDLFSVTVYENGSPRYIPF